jgi:large subunit ribosomal protein L17
MLANMAISLITHKRITTTLAKAKALRRYAEPLITKAKDNTTHSRRVVFSYLQNKDAVGELFSSIAEKIGERPGGYLRVIKLGFRRGDGAETALIEFVDFNELYNPNAGKVKTAKRTRRSSIKKTSADESIPTAEPTTTAETADPAAVNQEASTEPSPETISPENAVEMTADSPATTETPEPEINPTENKEENA